MLKIKSFYYFLQKIKSLTKFDFFFQKLNAAFNLLKLYFLPFFLF